MRVAGPGPRCRHESSRSTRLQTKAALHSRVASRASGWIRLLPRIRLRHETADRRIRRLHRCLAIDPTADPGIRLLTATWLLASARSEAGTVREEASAV